MVVESDSQTQTTCMHTQRKTVTSIVNHKTVPEQNDVIVHDHLSKGQCENQVSVPTSSDMSQVVTSDESMTEAQMEMVKVIQEKL